MANIIIVNSTPPRAFILFLNMFCRYDTDKLKICIDKFNDEKIDKFTAFNNTAHTE